jgi:predicted peroxiredoxin
VTVAFLVGGAAAEQGKEVTMFLTKEAVRLGLPGYADAVACEGCPPLAGLVQQYADNGGQLLVCPICFEARKLDKDALAGNAELGGRRRSGPGSGTAPRSSATEKTKVRGS